MTYYLIGIAIYVGLLSIVLGFLKPISNFIANLCSYLNKALKHEVPLHTRSTTALRK
jgi:hypothetical protein